MANRVHPSPQRVARLKKKSTALNLGSMLDDSGGLSKLPEKKKGAWESDNGVHEFSEVTS